MLLDHAFRRLASRRNALHAADPKFMRIDDLEWTLDRIEHIARHSISPEEVEEVFAWTPLFKRGRGGIYEAWGQTESGRYLLVIFRYLGHNRAWPITARDLDENEKKLLRSK